MVTVNATRTYLRTVIGLGNNAEGTERADAIMSEGLNDLADIHELANDDGIKTLCSSVRKPAGSQQEPSHNLDGWRRTQTQINSQPLRSQEQER